MREHRHDPRARLEPLAAGSRGEFHFEIGRLLAERLGHASADLDRIPAAAIDSFAGGGFYVDLGSGSGMDTFIAALRVGLGSKVIGVDMTDEQRANGGATVPVDTRSPMSRAISKRFAS